MADKQEERVLRLVEAGKNTRFKKGQSGHPGGRRRPFSLTALVLAEMDKPIAEGSKVTKGEMIAQNIVQMAALPSAKTFPYAKLVWEYTDGTPKEAIRQSVDDLAADMAKQYGIDKEELLREFERVTGTER